MDRPLGVAWRGLTNVERCAIGVLWKGISDALEISYQGMRGYEEGKGWSDGPEWLNDPSEWMERYEEKVMVPEDTNMVLAHQTISLFLWSVPTILKTTGDQGIKGILGSLLYSKIDTS